VDSARDVPTYDKKPEMSAREAAEALVGQWRNGDFSFGIINFANPDMVGHTGVIEAAVKAVETVDECLGQVMEAVHESGGVCIVTADHGNADQMLEPDGSPNTAHSMNPVPLVITGDVGELREDGTLADVAPTVLSLLGEAQPAEMSGTQLLRGQTPPPEGAKET
jgi:2,3-bisphosphoglycerate-independent phosphoglycerate mutase